MKTLTAVTPVTSHLPPELTLLFTPIRLEGAATPPDKIVGRSEGVLLDEQGRVVAFIVRLARSLAPRSPLVLVAAATMTVAPGDQLVLRWSEDQLLAQPRFDEELQRVPGPQHADGERPPPEEIQARDGDVDAAETAKEGVAGTAIGAAFGALIGLALLTPPGVLAMAAFFATGGGVLGLISGATREVAKTPADPADAVSTLENPALEQLEQHLRSSRYASAGLVHVTPFTSPAAEEALPTQHDTAA